MKKKEKK